MKTLGSSLALICVLVLSACDQAPSSANAGDTPSATPAVPVATPAPAPKPAPKPKPKPVKTVCADCGVISAIRDVKIEGEGTGMGAVSGAAAGGAIGNQFGKGSGKTAMTVVGVLAGAAAGHYAEKEIRSDTVHRVTVAMEDGSTRTVDLKELNGMGVGMKVRVSGNSIYLRDN